MTYLKSWESVYIFFVSAYESDNPKVDEFGNIYGSRKISSNINLV